MFAKNRTQEDIAALLNPPPLRSRLALMKAKDIQAALNAGIKKAITQAVTHEDDDLISITLTLADGRYLELSGPIKARIVGTVGAGRAY